MKTTDLTPTLKTCVLSLFLIILQNLQAGSSGLIWGTSSHGISMAIIPKASPIEFTHEEVINPSAMVERLIRHSDGVSDFIWKEMSDSERLALQEHGTSHHAADIAEDTALKGINKMVQGPCIYDDDRFKGVSLDSETASLLGAHQMTLGLTGTDLQHLNSLLLEDAFPGQLSRFPHAGPATIKIGGSVTLCVVLTNASDTNIFVMKQAAGLLDSSESYVVISPSGKKFTPGTDARHGQSAQTLRPRLLPHHVRDWDLQMSLMCKFDEVGTYTITVSRYIQRIGGETSTTLVSAPLNINIVP